VIGAPYRGPVAAFQRDETPRRRFPALDPEPPPPPWWRRLLWPACALAAAALVVTAVRLVPSFFPGSPTAPGHSRGAHHPRRGEGAGPAPPAAGRVVFVTQSGALALANPDGSHLARAGGFGNVGDSVAVSPDNRYISLLNGQVIRISPGPALASFPGKVQPGSGSAVALPDPFADHGQAVVMLQDFGDPTYSSTNPISVISIATGRSVALGSGDQVAGDPAAAGVFTTVSASIAAGAASLVTTPDARVVIRDAGRPPVLLVTARQLTRDLGLPRRLAVSLAVYPSPRGTEAAVTVRPAAGGPGGGLVILTRSGRTVARLPARAGAAPAPGGPAWSPSGKSLAYLGSTSGGSPELSVWSAGRRPLESSPLPASAGRYGECVWAPDATSVLCPASGGSQWVIAPAGGGLPAVVPGPGMPVAWLR
jgi:hypothetical protein